MRQALINRDGGSSHRETNQQKANEPISLSSYMQHQTGQQNSSNTKVSSSVTKMANVNNYQSANATNAGNLAVPQNVQQQTANKMSSSKSNASGSTTLKKIVPHQLIKQARNMSNDTAHTISQSSTNGKLLHRVRTSVDKTTVNYNNVSGNKVVQSQ